MIFCQADKARCVSPVLIKIGGYGRVQVSDFRHVSGSQYQEVDSCCWIKNRSEFQ